MLSFLFFYLKVKFENNNVSSEVGCRHNNLRQQRRLGSLWYEWVVINFASEGDSTWLHKLRSQHEKQKVGVGVCLLDVTMRFSACMNKVMVWEVCLQMPATVPTIFIQPWAGSVHYNPSAFHKSWPNTPFNVLLNILHLWAYDILLCLIRCNTQIGSSSSTYTWCIHKPIHASMNTLNKKLLLLWAASLNQFITCIHSSTHEFYWFHTFVKTIFCTSKSGLTDDLFKNNML